MLPGQDASVQRAPAAASAIPKYGPMAEIQPARVRRTHFEQRSKSQPPAPQHSTRGQQQQHHQQQQQFDTVTGQQRQQRQHASRDANAHGPQPAAQARGQATAASSQGQGQGPRMLTLQEDEVEWGSVAGPADPALQRALEVIKAKGPLCAVQALRSGCVGPSMEAGLAPAHCPATAAGPAVLVQIAV